MSNEKSLSVVRETAPAAQQIQPSSGGALAIRGFDEAVRLADLMARAQLVPQHLQGKPSDCLLVIEQAVRWGLSPFAVAQSTAVVRGKLMYEGKLVAGVINARGELEQRLRYDYSGAGPERTVVVTGRLRGEAEPRAITAKWSDLKTDNDVWKKQPDQQLAYAGARIWARRHMPELMLGVYTPDEMDEPAGTVRVMSPPASSGDDVPAIDVRTREVIDATPAEPKATAAQLKRLAIAMGELGYKSDDRDGRLAWCSERVGRALASSRDLTVAEASRIIEQATVEAKAKAAPPVEDDGEREPGVEG